MKSSKLIDKLNNRINIAFFAILLTGFASFMFTICNIACIVSDGFNLYLIQLINGNIIPLKLGLSIPLFILSIFYYNKLSSILNRIEERS